MSLVKKKYFNSNFLTFSSSSSSEQIDELNSMIQSYRNTISEKDAKLSELQTKLESLPAVDQREQELFKQIADYKEKNNVCSP